MDYNQFKIRNDSMNLGFQRGNGRSNNNLPNMPTPKPFAPVGRGAGAPQLQSIPILGGNQRPSERNVQGMMGSLVGGNQFRAPQRFGRAANPISGQQIRGSFKKGGHVKETGIYKLHKGEHVVPAKKKEIAKKMCD